MSKVFENAHLSALSRESCPDCGSKALTSNHKHLTPQTYGENTVIEPLESINVWFECGSRYKDVKLTGAEAAPEWDASETCGLITHLKMEELREQARAAEKAASVLRVPVEQLLERVEELIDKQEHLLEAIATEKSKQSGS